jgi:hypothetical protein
VLQPIAATIGAVKFLHRFDTEHLDVVTYSSDAIEVKDGAWKLKDGVTHGRACDKGLYCGSDPFHYFEL